MAKGYGNLLSGVFDGSVIPAKKADGRRVGAKIRTYREIFDLSTSIVAKNVGDTNVIAQRPSGSAFKGGGVTVSASLVNSTISIGTAANPTKYMAAQTITTPNQRVAFGNAAALAEDPISDIEEVIMTIAVAALPNAGFIITDFDTTAR